MATVFNKGTASHPRWFAKYKALDGGWKMAPTSKATKLDAIRAAEEIQARVNAGLPPLDEQKATTPPDAIGCGDLLRQYEKTLRTRSLKDDRSRLHRYLHPKWGAMPIARVTLAAVMTWIDELRAGTAPMAADPVDEQGKPVKRRGRKPKGATISDATIRHLLNLLSRFFSWAVPRGHAPHNPVRDIPTGSRPHQTAKPVNAPWINDDDIVRAVFLDLPRVVGLIFYLCNRSGMRSGEALGLRMGDLAFLTTRGVIRVEHSYDGPLKEDKRLEGKTKDVPAPDDAADLLSDWLAERRAAGAGPDDLVFPSQPSRGRRRDAKMQASGKPYRAEFLGRHWNEVAARHGLKMTFYEATRHSFTSRNLERHATLDEVSAALNHSSTVVTQRHYARNVRKTFSATLRAGLGLTGTAAPVIPIDRAKAK